MTKRLLLTTGILTILGLGFGARPVAAFEAHTISVTAKIELKPADHLVINEVYYDTNGRTHSTNGKTEEEGKNEWIELYNPTNAAINIQGWDICNSQECRNISANVSVPATGFAVISHDGDTWNYWNIPSTAEKTNLGGPLFELNNDSDTVILKNVSDEIVDQMSYGLNTSAFTPACSDVAEGHSLARKVKGYDTDQASDFEDLTNPNPGTNPHDPNYTNLPDDVTIGPANETTALEPVTETPAPEAPAETPAETVTPSPDPTLSTEAPAETPIETVEPVAENPEVISGESPAPPEEIVRPEQELTPPPEETLTNPPSEEPPAEPIPPENNEQNPISQT